MALTSNGDSSYTFIAVFTLEKSLWWNVRMTLRSLKDLPQMEQEKEYILCALARNISIVAYTQAVVSARTSELVIVDIEAHCHSWNYIAPSPKNISCSVQLESYFTSKSPTC